MPEAKVQSTRFACAATVCALLAVAAGPFPALAQEAAREVSIVRTAEEVAGYVVVTDDEAEILVRPDDEAGVLEIAGDGDVFPYRERRGAWYLVSTAERGEGWVHGESVAMMFYPEYLLRWQPPDEWEPPEAGWVPPPGWVPGPGWVKRHDRWYPPPRWSPVWWRKWYHRDRYERLSPRRHREPGWKPRHSVPPPSRIPPGGKPVKRYPLPPR